jgi:hypothetical protein
LVVTTGIHFQRIRNRVGRYEQACYALTVFANSFSFFYQQKGEGDSLEIGRIMLSLKILSHHIKHIEE